jgi:hypothetical protein
MPCTPPPAAADHQGRVAAADNEAAAAAAARGEQAGTAVAHAAHGDLQHGAAGELELGADQGAASTHHLRIVSDRAVRPHRLQADGRGPGGTRGADGLGRGGQGQGGDGGEQQAGHGEAPSWAPARARKCRATA